MWCVLTINMMTIHYHTNENDLISILTPAGYPASWNSIDGETLPGFPTIFLEILQLCHPVIDQRVTVYSLSCVSAQQVPPTSQILIGMAYLPTKLGHFKMVNVNKYSIWVSTPRWLHGASSIPSFQVAEYFPWRNVCMSFLHWFDQSEAEIGWRKSLETPGPRTAPPEDVGKSTGFDPQLLRHQWYNVMIHSQAVEIGGIRNWFRCHHSWMVGGSNHCQELLVNWVISLVVRFGN